MVSVCGLLAAYEFYRLAASSRISPLTYFGLVWVVLFIISPHFNNNFVTPLLLSSAIILSLIWLIIRSSRETAFASWVWTLAGILYIGWLLSFLVALRNFDGGIAGRDWVIFALLTNIGSDTTAYFIGKRWGRHHLAPHISPNKTWEGAIAGVFGSIIVGVVLINLLDLPLSYGGAILLGLLVSIFGQLGDLAESLFKRNMDAKDSGKLLPGHGGLLDRLDSIFFTGVVVYYFAQFASGTGFLT